MNLIELIKQHASEAATAGDYSAVAAVLNDNSVEVIDNTYYTSRKLLPLLGVDNYRIVSGSLAALGQFDPIIRDMHQMLTSTGLPFAEPMTQAMIEQLGSGIGWPQQLVEIFGQGWPQQVIDTLKELGRSHTSLALKELGAAVTAEQCEAAWMKDILTATVRDRSATARYGIDGGSITTLEQLNAVLGGA